jgi:NitT/TauT family transport system ATP-binding protein
MAQAPAPAPIISVEQVTKTFPTPDGRLPVLDGIDFELYPGEIVALLGKSGSGKSTLLRCIAGLIEPSTGRVAYKGTQLNGRTRASRWSSRASRCCPG